MIRLLRAIGVAVLEHIDRAVTSYANATHQGIEDGDE